jgi:hypothetical protein
LRVTLSVDDAQAYWELINPTAPREDLALVAFEQRWFGVKSLDQVKRVLADFAARFDRFPSAFAMIRRWRPVPAMVRPLICHWHLQLADPLYRKFTGEYLVERRSTARATVDRERAARWVRDLAGDRWAHSTSIQFASKLLSTALEAGLVAGRRDPRDLPFPVVPDEALAYLLFALRGIDFIGTLLDNPYLASVGLSGAALDDRLRRLPGLTFRRLGDVTDLDWSAASFESWTSQLAEAR